MLLSLTETVGELLRPHHRTLGTLFGSGLTDASSRVRGAALRAVAELCRWVSTDEEAATVCALVPSVLAAGVASRARAPSARSRRRRIPPFLSEMK